MGFGVDPWVDPWVAEGARVQSLSCGFCSLPPSGRLLAVAEVHCQSLVALPCRRPRRPRPPLSRGRSSGEALPGAPPVVVEPVAQGPEVVPLETLRDRSRVRLGELQRGRVVERQRGLGEHRRKALVTHFGSVARLKQASVEEITAVPGIGVATARAVLEALGVRPDSDAPDPVISDDQTRASG